MKGLLKDNDGNMRDIRLEADLRELRRLAHLRRMLEVEATIFTERAPRECVGECKYPVPIGVLGLTCCHFYLGYQRYNDTLRLELRQRQVVEAGRSMHRRDRGRPEIEGSGLQSQYYRDWTGTARLRRLEVEERAEPSEKPEASLQAHHRETLNKLKAAFVYLTLGVITATAVNTMVGLDDDPLPAVQVLYRGTSGFS